MSPFSAFTATDQTLMAGCVIVCTQLPSIKYGVRVGEEGEGGGGGDPAFPYPQRPVFTAGEYFTGGQCRDGVDVIRMAMQLLEFEAIRRPYTDCPECNLRQRFPQPPSLPPGLHSRIVGTACKESIGQLAKPPHAIGVASQQPDLLPILPYPDRLVGASGNNDGFRERKNGPDSSLVPSQYAVRLPVLPDTRSAAARVSTG